MAMTEEEIASAAARRSAARRKRVRKRCELCGTEFEGLTTKRYCSDRCRVQAARNRGHTLDGADKPTVSGPEGADGPPFDALPTEEEIERLLTLDAPDAFAQLRKLFYGDYVFDTDAVEDIRRQREGRSEHLAKLTGS